MFSQLLLLHYTRLPRQWTRSRTYPLCQDEPPVSTRGNLLDSGGLLDWFKGCCIFCLRLKQSCTPLVSLVTSQLTQFVGQRDPPHECLTLSQIVFPYRSLQHYGIFLNRKDDVSRETACVLNIVLFPPFVVTPHSLSCTLNLWQYPIINRSAPCVFLLFQGQNNTSISYSGEKIFWITVKGNIIHAWLYSCFIEYIQFCSLSVAATILHSTYQQFKNGRKLLSYEDYFSALIGYSLQPLLKVIFEAYSTAR